ncbi:MAG: hypothetical protein C0404_04110 [Verrucomicrobia bacterium]|nr:hypothetical protein [Verrucomicrobiota bacterium]
MESKGPWMFELVPARSAGIGRMLLFFLSLLIVHLVQSADAEELTLQLGTEVSGRLDNDDKQEERYQLKLTAPKGIYNLSVSKIAGALPSVSVVSDALYEPLYIDSSLFEDGPQELTLPAGDYGIGIANDTRNKSLAYKLQLTYVSAWDDSLEWEPNDENASQYLQADKPVRGRVTGADEDNYLFTVAKDRALAYDITLDTTNKESLLVMIMAHGTETGDDQGRCLLARREERGYAMRGVALNEGQYVISIGRSPGTAASGYAGKRRLPAVHYVVTASAAKKAMSTLVPDVLAFKTAERNSTSYSLQEHLSRRKIVEEDIERQNIKHRGLVMSRDRAVNLSLVKQEFPGSFEDMKKKTVAMTEESVTGLGAVLLADNTVKSACQAFTRKTGHGDERQASRFAGIWADWDMIPDQWIMELLGGPAAKAARKEAAKSQHVLSVMVLSPYGVVVAATVRPPGLWMGGSEIWKRWRERGDQKVVSTEPAFDQEAGRWLMESAVPVKEGSALAGVMVFRTVIAK